MELFLLFQIDSDLLKGKDYQVFVELRYPAPTVELRYQFTFT